MTAVFLTIGVAVFAVVFLLRRSAELRTSGLILLRSVVHLGIVIRT